MQRIVFEKTPLDGFRSTRTESIAMTAAGKRLFAGTNDGSLVLYECRPDTYGTTNKAYNCAILDTLRKQSKEKKPVSSLVSVESWRVLLGIIDGTVMAYDSQFYQLLGSITENKGCHLFAVNEKNYTIVVANKKKLFLYGWQGSGFLLKKDFNLIDVPKSIHCSANGTIIGYRKFYECLDLTSGLTSRILDVEKENKMVQLELPASPFRQQSLLLSLGPQGVVLDIVKILAGVSFAYGSPNEERIGWAGLPLSAHLVQAFIVTQLADGIEVHDVVTLASLQRLTISPISSSPLGLCTAFVESSSSSSSASASAQTSGGGSVYTVSTAGRTGDHYVFVANGDTVSSLKMAPVATQVQAMVSAGMFEESITLYTMFSDAGKYPVPGVNPARLYELCGAALLSKGDFEKASLNFIAGATDFIHVVKLFPDLVPLPLHSMLGLTTSAAGGGGGGGSARKLIGAALQRAASALVTFCDHHRPRMERRAQRAESIKSAGVMASSSSGIMGGGRGSVNKNATSRDDDAYIADPEEEIKRAVILDTVLLSSLVNCFPSRRAAAVELLSSPNRCQIESCSVLLASQGNSYTEALLWLFRSQNQHARVLQALSEDKCVGVGAWTRDQFYKWASEYLQWLWYHEEDASLPRQALFALKSVLEYDAEIGLSVLVNRPQGKVSFGGKGVTISDVLAFLRSVSPKSVVKGSGGFGESSSKNNIKGSSSAGGIGPNSPGVQAVLSSTPLVNGHSLGVAFLECLVSSGEAPASMHDEFAQLLVEGLPLDNDAQMQDVVHARNDLEPRDSDPEAVMLYKIYRKKLQNFLLNSTEYHPLRVMKFLPPQYLQENALVLSRLGRHEEVLRIYVRQLANLPIAESYCGRIYTGYKDIQASGGITELASSSSMNSNPYAMAEQPQQQSVVADPLSAQYATAADIYLTLFKVLLDTESESSGLGWVGGSEAAAAAATPSLAIGSDALHTVINLGERYFDRFNTEEFIDMLPSSTPVSALLRFLQIVMEYGNTKKRNLKIIHQLMRIREVGIRTNYGSSGKK